MKTKPIKLTITKLNCFALKRLSKLQLKLKLLKQTKLSSSLKLKCCLFVNNLHLPPPPINARHSLSNEQHADQAVNLRSFSSDILHAEYTE